MRTKSHVRALALGLATSIGICVLAGCGQKGDAPADASGVSESVEADAAAESSSEVTTETAESSPTAKEAAAEALKHEIVRVGDDGASVKVGMVCDVGGINDHSFNQSAWDGMLFLNSNLNARVSYVETTSTEEFVTDLSRLAEDGNDVCWGIGYQFSDAILEAAGNYPDKHFAIVDYAYDRVPDNVTCAVFSAEEPSFIVGYVAGRMTESGKVGFIGGMDVNAIHAFQYGYMAGVDRADSETGGSTEVMCEFIGSFDDAEGGKAAALDMYDQGCDVIFHAAGGTGVGVIEAAGETGKYVIGVDCDQSYLAPDVVLTSAVKKVDVIVSNISVQYGMGDNVGGKMIEYGLKEHAVGIPDEHPLIPDEIYDAAKQMEQEIMYGGLEVPSNETEYAAFTSK